MTVSRPKKTFTKEEIIDILKRNARLFKDEPEFVTYIVELALYLIEHHLEKEERLAKEGKIEKGEPPLKISREQVRSVYNIFERFSGTENAKRTCPICGAPTEGKMRCPNCDAMLF